MSKEWCFCRVGRLCNDERIARTLRQYVAAARETRAADGGSTVTLADLTMMMIRSILSLTAIGLLSACQSQPRSDTCARYRSAANNTAILLSERMKQPAASSQPCTSPTVAQP